MQKLQDSVFSIVKTTNLSPAVFNFLQPTEDISDKTPLGGILNDTKHGWLALGPKFCVVDLRTGLKVAARIFGTPYSNSRTTVTSVVELPTPLSENSKQLVISLQCEDITSTICVFHINGSQILRCIQTDLVVVELAVCDEMPDGPFTCFDGVIMAGTRSGEVFAFDLNKAGLIQALKDISQGYEHLIQNESNPSNLTFLPLNELHLLEEQRDLALANNDHLAILFNENSIVDGQYIFRNPDGSIRMKAKKDHIRVTVLQYIPQLGSLAVGYNFGAFQIWNLLTLDLEFTSQVNVECLPVTHFGFQEPCDDPRAFCYLWVVFSVLDRFEEEGFPLAVMYSLTYQGKRMLSDTKCLYQEFSMATIRFQVELSAMDDTGHLVGGKCVSCHTYSVDSTLGSEGEDSMLNICQLVWECWGDNANSSAQHGMLLFDLDQWYKDQMPATYRLESNAFMSATWCSSLAQGACVTLDVRLEPASVAPYSHATRLEEHFYPNSLQYHCICLNTSESCVLNTIGIQRQIISSMDDVGPTALLNPLRLYNACVAAGLTPLYTNTYNRDLSQEEQRRFLLSVALEARLSRFLKRCAHDWAPGSHAGAGCTLPLLVDWCWQRAIELKENARELTAPLFSSSALPDRNVVRCLEHCVQQLTQLTGLLDAILTKCCNLVVPEALSSMEEKYKGIGTVSLYFQVVQWFLRVGLLPERAEHDPHLPYPAHHLYSTYTKRRMKLQRLEDHSSSDGKPDKSCSLLYIDQLIENEFGGERIREMWLKGGSECSGLYPPPSLYSLLRLYLLPDIPEEHKHSLVLYLLVDYSVVYDEIRYETVIRRLMQFPTMFGLSNTAIKATQAFWHLDHRDFDFALDQLQCLTGNTLSEWQHSVVLSSLLAQKKTQAALQYLHVRKPAPIQCGDADPALNSSRVNDHDKLEDWQSCCNLYLARGLVFEALDVVRMCVLNAATNEDKVHILGFFFKGCRNTGQLSKVLQVTLLPLEEDVFIKYLQSCNDTQTSDILVMYYLQQARYLEAEQYNSKLKHSKSSRLKDPGSVESLASLLDREGARDTIVEVVCASLPAITTSVRDFVLSDKDLEPHVMAPKPMSVFVHAKSPKNTFTYKSSFIQDTIENASETWLNRPKMRRGIKRALNIEETPFICTPKLTRTKSIFADFPSETTPSKRPKIDLNTTPRTPKFGSAVKPNLELSRQMASLLDMPLVQSPDLNLYNERSGAGTPHSILKIRRNEAMDRDAPSPVDSRYLGDSDDEMLETASNHTHYSDSTNKHLRFTIPTASESGSTPSPPTATAAPAYVHRDIVKEREMSISAAVERERDESSHATSRSHAMDDTNPLESPPKKLATEETVKSRKSYKDTVRARRSLSISANSSLSEDPNTSIESIADIPITLINPRYSAEMRRRQERRSVEAQEDDKSMVQESDKAEVKESVQVPKTPTGRRGIRAGGESTPLINRSRSGTPERMDSPITPLRTGRVTRSRSRTPDISPRSSPLQSIPEVPRQEVASEEHAVRSTLSVPRQRSRSRTPERVEKGVAESPRLEAITESPTKPIAADTPASPTRRSLRSRSRTPDVEMAPEEDRPSSPRSLRSRAKTPEKLMSPKREPSARGKKPLSRLVLENNTFAKLKSEAEQVQEEVQSAIECTPMKTIKQVPSLMDVTLSPIVNKSVLQSSTDSALSETVDKDATKHADKSTAELGMKSIPAFTTIHETYFEKSVLRSYQSSVADDSESFVEEKEAKPEDSVTNVHLKSLPAFTTINDTELNRSVLRSYQSSIADSSQSIIEETKETKITETSVSKPFVIETSFEKSVLKSYQSSMAESSQELSKDETKSALKDASLITNDSDADMKADEWKAKLDSQDTVIQKEKEKIVDIEREINEIEGDMTDDSDDSEEAASSGDEEIVEAEDDDDDDDSEDEEAEEGEDDSSEVTTSSEGDEEIISIKDTESDNSSSSNKLQIDEGTSTDADEQDTEKLLQVIAEVQEDKSDDKEEIIHKDDGNDVDPLNQGQMSMLTDDNSEVDNEQCDMKLNWSGEDKASDENQAEDIPMEVTAEKPEVQVVITVETIAPTVTDDTNETAVPKDIDMVDSVAPVESSETVAVEPEKTTPDIVPGKTTEVEKATDEAPKVESQTTKTDSNAEEIKEKVEVTSQSESETQLEKSPSKTRKRTKSTSSNKTISELKGDVEHSNAEEIKEKVEVTSQSESETQLEKSPSRTRKRTKSTSSNKTISELKEDVETETPATRKRTQSNASNKSETEVKTPENETATPSRRRAKTPSSTEVRKIITRRASREMSEKLDESKDALDDSVTATPRRRSTRSRTKNIDDNESVASESSVKSVRSRASEDAGDVKAAPIRKGRKSILSTKPDLSVIPEMIVEEESKGAEGIISDYSSSRRLTRHQKAVLESWLEPSASPSRPPRRRASAASRTSGVSADDDDASSTHSFDVHTMDRINLLNKQDFEGSPDTDEYMHDKHAGSPDSLASDASKQRRARAASESRPTPKAAKIGRRTSVDIGESSDVGSPAGVGSPARGRRASFNKACEALTTPRGRRASTDLRKETESPVESPTPSESEQASTPARRVRRAASTASNASQAKSDTGKRSKKTSALDESKDKKK